MDKKETLKYDDYDILIDQTCVAIYETKVNKNDMKILKTIMLEKRFILLDFIME